MKWYVVIGCGGEKMIDEESIVVGERFVEGASEN